MAPQRLLHSVRGTGETHDWQAVQSHGAAEVGPSAGHIQIRPAKWKDAPFLSRRTKAGRTARSPLRRKRGPLRLCHTKRSEGAKWASKGHHGKGCKRGSVSCCLAQALGLKPETSPAITRCDRSKTGNFPHMTGKQGIERLRPVFAAVSTAKGHRARPRATKPKVRRLGGKDKERDTTLICRAALPGPALCPKSLPAKNLLRTRLPFERPGTTSNGICHSEKTKNDPRSLKANGADPDYTLRDGSDQARRAPEPQPLFHGPPRWPSITAHRPFAGAPVSRACPTRPIRPAGILPRQ